MSFKVLSILLLLIFITKNSYQKSKMIKYSNFQVTFNPEFISNFTVDWSLHDNTTGDLPTFVEPITYTMIKEIHNVKIQAVTFIKTSKYVGFDQTFNICSYLRIKKANIFVRMISAEFDKSTTFPIICPFQKGEYKIQRMKVPHLMVPSFVKTTDVNTAQLTLITKIRSQLHKYLVMSIDWQLIEID